MLQRFYSCDIQCWQLSQCWKQSACSFLLANISSCSPSPAGFCFCFCPTDTKLWLKPAPSSPTSTSFHRETRQRSASGSAMQLKWFFLRQEVLCSHLQRFKSPFLMQGINLSGGQKQRISVARALYQQTNMVFLVSAWYTHSHTRRHPWKSQIRTVH